LIGCFQAQLSGAPFCNRKRKPIVSFVNGLKQGASRYLSTRARSLEQRYASPQCRAQPARDVDFAARADQRFVFDDRVRRDETEAVGARSSGRNGTKRR